MPAPTTFNSAVSQALYLQSKSAPQRAIVCVALSALSILAATLCLAHGGSFPLVFSGVTYLFLAGGNIAWTIYQNKKSSENDTAKQKEYKPKEAVQATVMTLGAPLTLPIAVAHFADKWVKSDLLPILK